MLENVSCLGSGRCPSRESRNCQASRRHYNKQAEFFKLSAPNKENEQELFWFTNKSVNAINTFLKSHEKSLWTHCSLSRKVDPRGRDVWIQQIEVWVNVDWVVTKYCARPPTILILLIIYKHKNVSDIRKELCAFMQLVVQNKRPFQVLVLKHVTLLNKSDLDMQIKKPPSTDATLALIRSGFLLVSRREMFWEDNKLTKALGLPQSLCLPSGQINR